MAVSAVSVCANVLMHRGGGSMQRNGSSMKVIQTVTIGAVRVASL